MAGLPQTIAEESSHYGQDYMNHRNVPLGAGMPAHDPSLQQVLQLCEIGVDSKLKMSIRVPLIGIVIVVYYVVS